MPLTSILVAYDGTKPSIAALDTAVEIAGHTGAKITIVCVIPLIAASYGIEMPPGSSVGETIEAARTMLANEKLALGKRGVAHADTVLLEGDPVDRIVEFVEKHPTDLIVVGSRGLSEAGRFFLGSVSDGILHHVRCSVLVVKSGTAPHPRSASQAM
jgi:nucleotide-binding universal stress UspA family protein